MNNIYISFVLTIIAGLSTLIGFLFSFLKMKNEKKFLAFSLGFASSIMISVSIFDILPESFNILSFKYQSLFLILIMFLFILFGIFLSYLISNIKINENNKLYKLGLISMIALVIHNIPEGIATFITTNNNIDLGIKMALAISFHNIPEGICIAIPIYYATHSKKSAFLYTLIASLSEPFGGLISYFFLINIVSEVILAYLYLIIIGIMLFIAILKLLPSSISYKYYKLSFISFGVGFLLIILFH